MTIIYAAGTAPINPEGVSPVLTLDKVWAGLELKRGYEQPIQSRINVFP